MRELWIDTWRSIVAHRVRFGLTAIGIAWGAFMLTFLSSTTQGFEQHFISEFEEVGPKVVFMGTGTVLKEGLGERNARIVEVEAQDVQQLEALQRIEAATPEVGVWSVPVRTGRRSKLLRLSGLDADAETIRELDVAAGRFLSPTDIDRNARVAVLGARAAERLFDRRSAVGESLTLDGYRFRVIGILEAKGDQLMNSSDPDDLKVIVPYTTAQRWMTHTEKVETFTYAPHHKDMIDASVRQVREVTALREGYDPEIESAMWSFSVQEPLQLIRGVFLGVQVFLFGAGLVTLFVGAVGVMNIMLVVVGERTQEIGVRKAIGARGRDIFIQFLAEAAVVSGLSGLLGAALGVGMVQVVSLVIPEGTAYQSPPALDPATVAILTLALVGVGIVAGAIPAVRAARTPPAEALRAS